MSYFQGEKNKEFKGTISRFHSATLQKLSEGFLKEEGRAKQIMNVTLQKHKAIHWQSPRTA